MTHIINKSLTSGILPKLCKEALVTPIYKGEGDKLDPGNYRPISILPLLGKCIEYFVYQNLTNYITENNIYSSKEKGRKPAIVFLDIKKA